MRTVEIDDELFGYLQSKAIPYVETPNMTLRRLLVVIQYLKRHNSRHQGS